MPNNFCSLFCSEVGYLVCYLGKSVRRPSVQQDTALMGFFHGEKKLETRFDIQPLFYAFRSFKDKEVAVCMIRCSFLLLQSQLSVSVSAVLANEGHFLCLPLYIYKRAI